MKAALTRRRLVAAAAALPATSALGWIAAGAPAAGFIAALAAVGRLALTRGVMTAEAAAPVDLATALGSPAASARLYRDIATDFANGAVVRLDGWVLSVTEVKVCIAAHLEAMAAA